MSGKTKTIPVIMAGGAGVRLWPLSDAEKPKQFHDFSGDGTLLENTAKRLIPLSPEICVVVTSGKYADMSAASAEKAGLRPVVLCEPRPRNTSAAVLYAAVYLDKLYGDSVMTVLSADHHISDGRAFAETIALAVMEAEQDKLVTIGIRPSYPETGYGYIKGKAGAGGDVMPVERFVEKPDRASAEQYLREGTYFWNAGIFVWRTAVILKAFEEFLPDMFSAFDELRSMEAAQIASNEESIWKIKADIFNRIKSISIDYGILEKASNRSVVPGDFGWTDLGSWKSVDSVIAPDALGNRASAQEKAIFVNSADCSVFSESMQIAVVGLENVTVVQSGGNILVMNKDASQDVRRVVDIIASKPKE